MKEALQVVRAQDEAREMSFLTVTRVAWKGRESAPSEWDSHLAVAFR